MSDLFSSRLRQVREAYDALVGRPNAPDTRMHVATSTVEALVDYCTKTPPDGLTSDASVEARYRLIERNLAFQRKEGDRGS